MEDSGTFQLRKQESERGVKALSKAIALLSMGSELNYVKSPH